MTTSKGWVYYLLTFHMLNGNDTVYSFSSYDNAKILYDKLITKEGIKDLCISGVVHGVSRPKDIAIIQSEEE